MQSGASTLLKASAGIPASAEAPLIIVGAGPVGVRLVKDLLARNFRRPIVMFGDEPWQPYNRVQLSSLLAGEVHIDRIGNPVEFPGREAAASAHADVLQHLGCRIAAIDPASHTVTDTFGTRYDYYKLVLATGSSAHIPNVTGTDKSGVFTLRNLRDTEALMARTARSRHVVVIGGGLLGLEAARALQRRSAQVTVVQQGTRLMNRQLDDEAAALLNRRVEGLGITTRFSAGLAEILGGDRVSGVRLRDGQLLECDTVLLATGVRPNIELARNAWIKVASGVVVDETLRTSQPDIYAIGECAEFGGRTYGVVAPGYEQSAVLADRLCGGTAAYGGSIDAAHLKVVGEAVFSVGEVVDLPSRALQREWIWRDRQGGRYRKLVTHRGRLLGALSVGESDENPRLLEAVKNNRKLRWWELLRFYRFGHCWGDASAQVALWPATTVVCQCTGVNRGQLSLCVQNGCSSVAALRQATGASSVCGSCAPLLQNLIGDAAEREPAAGAGALWTLALVVCALLLTWLFVPALTVTESLEGGERLDRFWNDGFWKQVTGFSVVGLGLVGLLMSLRKRIPLFRFGGYASWRIAHVAVGVACVLVLGMHTGLHSGHRFNQWLFVDFIAVLAVGALAGVVLGQEHRVAPALARVLRSGAVWGHVVTVWPLPVLLIFHVLTVYYF